MSTTSLGPNTRNITSNISGETYIEFKKLASISGGSLSEYTRALCEYAVKHHLVAGPNSEDHAMWIIAIQNGTSPLPKVRLEIKAGPPERLKIYNPDGEEPKPLPTAEPLKAQKR